MSTRKHRHQPYRFAPSLERLETRAVPAGNVLAMVMKGTLYVAGDPLDNAIRIQSVGVGTVMITPTDGTTEVNGQSGPVTLGGANGVVSINLGDGNNQLNLSGLTVQKELFIGTGSGNDTVSLSGVNVGKMLAIVTGAGNDQVSIVNTTARRQLTVDTGAGDDSVNIASSRFGRRSVLQGGDGNDRLAATVDEFARLPAVVGFESISTTPGQTPTPTPTPAAPVANDVKASVSQGNSVAINLAAHATDPAGMLNPASVAVTQQPTHGTVTPNGDGTVTYAQDGSAATSDSFQYTIQDVDGVVSNVATVTIAISVSPPTALPDTATVANGGSVSIDVAANDFAQSGKLDLTSVTIAQKPAHGTATPNGDGTVTYVHDGSATTSDAFQYTIKDSNGNVSNLATVGITITPAPANQPPVANDDTATVATGGNVVINVAANDTAPGGQLDPTSVAITQQPAHGVATSDANGSVTYIQDGTAATSDAFRYTIKDNHGTVSNEATVTITIT
jgi:hypothetical protein